MTGSRGGGAATQAFLPTFRLDGKVALLTGAGRGLGRAIALALAAAGCDLALVARSGDELEAVADEARRLGRRAVAMPADVTESTAAGAAAERAVGELGSLDIFVHSAGVAYTRPALEVTRREWQDTIDVNLSAAFFWAQAAARAMVKRGGRIIHVSSVTGQTGVSRLVAYCASKAGLDGMVRALAVEWAPYGITVNAICPGYVKTALNAEALEDGRVMRYITARTPMGRLGSPGEVAAAALFLASDAASYVTGHTLAVDGGWLAG